MFNILEMIDAEIAKMEGMTPSEFADYVASGDGYDPIWDDIYSITKSLSDMEDSYVYVEGRVTWPSVMDKIIVQYRKFSEQKPIYHNVTMDLMDVYDSVAEAA